MKIAFVNYNQFTEQYTPQEWITRIRPYFGVLEQLAHKHEVYYISVFPRSCEYRFQNVTCYFKAASNRISSCIKINNLVRKKHPDLVVVYGLHFPIAVHLLRKLVDKNTRIILQSHADTASTGWRKYIQQHAYRSVSYSFFSSEDLAKPFTDNGIFTSRQIRDIMPASSFFSLIEKEQALTHTFTEGNPCFLWVGRLDKNKDPLLVVDCFLQWVKKNPSACLYMIYQNNDLMPELNSLLKNYPCWTNNLVLVGKIPHHELVHWYNSADFFISGSHAESYGLSLCEAMSCGSIPIVTNIPSFRKMTGNGNCGILYEAGNKAALLNALDSTVRMDINKEKKAVLNYFRKNISFESIAEKFESVIDEFNLLYKVV